MNKLICFICLLSVNCFAQKLINLNQTNYFEGSVRVDGPLYGAPTFGATLSANFTLRNLYNTIGTLSLDWGDGVSVADLNGHIVMLGNIGTRTYYDDVDSVAMDLVARQLTFDADSPALSWTTKVTVHSNLTVLGSTNWFIGNIAVGGKYYGDGSALTGIGSGAGTFNAAALTNWPNTTATNLSQRITSATTNKVVNGGYYTVNADDTLAWYVPVPSGATVVGPYGLVSQGGFFGDGNNLTNLNATQLLTGTIPAAQAGELSNHLHMAGTPLTAGDIYGWDGSKFTNGPPAAGTGSTPNAITNHYWPTPIGFSNTLSFEITNNLAPLIFSNANATINRGGVGSATRGAGVALYGFPAGIVTKLIEAYDDTVLITNTSVFIVRAGGSGNYVRVDDGALQVNGGNILLNNPGVYIGNGTSLTNMSLSKPKLATVLTDGATINTDVSTNTYFRVTLGGNRTLANPVNAGGAQDGEKVIWEIVQDATGNRTITMDTKFTFGTDITGITLTTNASKRDFISAIYNSTADLWYVVGFVRGY